MSDWRESFLNETIEIIGGGTPKTSKDEYWSGDIPWLSVVDFGNDNRWVFETEKSITERGLKNSSTKLLDEGDLIISARGTVGELAQLSKPMAFNQSCYGLRAKPPLTNGYLYYLLKYSLLKLKKNTHGSVFSTITKDTFQNIDIKYPENPLEIDQIEKALSCLDLKIDNLQRQNQTLEKIAQNLFKQWFVDFNFPDKNGKPYKDNGGEMVGAELGGIPKGWKTSLLKDVLQVKHGFAFKGKYITTEETDKILVTPGNFQIGGGFKNTKFKYYSDENISSDYILKKKDLMITMTDLSKDGDTLGFPAFIPAITNKTILHNQRIGLVEDNKIDNTFLYFLLCRREYRAHILATASGSTVRHTSPSRIYDFEFVLPSEKILSLFIEVVSKPINKMQINFEQIQTLIKTRDTLLPKLMSGQIRISD